MVEGWYGDDYFILFADSEITSASDRYAISELLPGYQVQGLRGWDDFILRDMDGHTHLVPAVPIDIKFVRPFAIPEETRTLKSDQRFRGKIKWYLKPIVFGGDANVGENLIWVDHEQHAQLVKWWNGRYRSLKQQTSSN